MTEFLAWIINSDRRFFAVLDLLEKRVNLVPFVALVLKRLWEFRNQIKHAEVPMDANQIALLYYRVEMDIV